MEQATTQNEDPIEEVSISGSHFHVRAKKLVLLQSFSILLNLKIVDRFLLVPLFCQIFSFFYVLAVLLLCVILDYLSLLLISFSDRFQQEL